MDSNAQDQHARKHKMKTIKALIVAAISLLAIGAQAQTIYSSPATWKIDDSDDLSVFPTYLAPTTTTNTYLVSLEGSAYQNTHIAPPFNQPWSLVFRGRGVAAGVSNVVLTFTYGLTGKPYADGNSGRTYRSTGFTWTIALNGTNWVSKTFSTNSGAVPVIFLESVATGDLGYTNGSLQRVLRTRN